MFDISEREPSVIYRLYQLSLSAVTASLSPVRFSTYLEIQYHSVISVF